MAGNVLEPGTLTFTEIYKLVKTTESQTQNSEWLQFLSYPAIALSEIRWSP